MTRTVIVRFRGTRRQAIDAVRTFARDLVSDTKNDTQAELTGAVAKTIFAENRKQFIKKSNGYSDDFGNSWEPLKPATIKRKGHNKINIDTGDMLESLSPGRGFGVHYRPSKGQIYEVRNGSIALGSSVYYTKYVNKKRRVMFRRREAAFAVKIGTERGIEPAVRAWNRG